MANVSLGNHFEGFVKELVEAGDYNSSSEVIRHGLRLVEERYKEKELRLELLRQEIQKGIDSGSAGELDMGDIRTQARAKLSQEKKA